MRVAGRGPGQAESMPNLKYGPTLTTQVIWKSIESPGMQFGELLA